MKPVYTLDDFKTRMGKHVFNLCHPRVDYNLLNRFEPKDPNSLSEHMSIVQDKDVLVRLMVEYITNTKMPNAAVTLPSGKTITPEELVTFQETMRLKTYMDMVHTLEEVLDAHHKAEDVFDILNGKTQIAQPKLFKSAIDTCPAEATYIRIEFNNPFLAHDRGLYVHVQEFTFATLNQTQFKDDKGKTIAVPRIGGELGPRPAPLGERGVLALFNFWKNLDKQEADIKQMYLERQGLEPGSKPT